MLETVVRPFYQNFFINSIAAKVAGFLCPNQITLLSVFFGLLIPVFLTLHYPWLALASLLTSGFCDTLDGSVARISGLDSDLGCVFDIVADRAVEFLIVFGLFLVAPVNRALPSILMLGAILICVTSFLVVSFFLNDADEPEKGFFYSIGLMERFEAFIFFGLMMVLPQYFDILAYTFSALVFLTGIMHIVKQCKVGLARSSA